MTDIATDRGTDIHIISSNVWSGGRAKMELELMKLDTSVWQPGDAVHLYFEEKAGKAPKELALRMMWRNLIDHLADSFHTFVRKFTIKKVKYFYPILIEKLLEDPVWGVRGKPDVVFKWPDGKYMIDDYKSGAGAKMKTEYRVAFAIYDRLVAVQEKADIGNMWNRLVRLGGEGAFEFPPYQITAQTWATIPRKILATRILVKKLLECKSYDEAERLYPPDCNFWKWKGCYYRAVCETGIRASEERERKRDEILRCLSKFDSENDYGEPGEDSIFDD